MKIEYLKVFVDDERLPTEEGWILVRWPVEAIELLKTNKMISLSIDLDLSKDMPEDPNDKSYGAGYDVLLLIEEQAT